MPSHGQELSSIDFESLIGGPLSAIVRAQAKSAMSTIDFIQSVGFDKHNNAIPLKFKAVRSVPQDNGNYANVTHEMTVPILSALPIPFLRVESARIEFNAKITSMEYVDTKTSVGADASIEGEAGWGWGSVKLKASASYKSTSRNGNQTNRSYSMNVVVNAVQDEMPEGMERILEFLTESVTSIPTSSNGTVDNDNGTVDNDNGTVDNDNDTG